MSMELPPPENLTGSLLVANPTLLDASFRRSIVYISHHDEEDGALGLILNRPLGKTVSDLSKTKGPECLLPVPVYEGGPVQKEGVLIASIQWREIAQDVSFVKIDEAKDVENLTLPQRRNLRAFLGYAGWNQHQLEGEIAQKAWFVIKPQRDLITAGNTDEIWKMIMRKLGPLYHLLAETPDDPSLN